MSSLIVKIEAGFTRITMLLKQVRDDLAGKTGDLSTLTTVQKSDVVSALNEVNARASAAAVIDDSQAGAATTWSGQKIDTTVKAAIASVVAGAGEDSDTLKELADHIAALAQADAGLVSAAGVQTFTVSQKAQGRDNIGAASAEDLGDVASADFVTLINSSYAGA